MHNCYDLLPVHNGYILTDKGAEGRVRVNWDRKKSELLRRERGIGFDEALEVFNQPYVVQHKTDDPEQYKAIGFVKGRLVTLIVEVRHDDSGEYEWLVTLWKSTASEAKVYEQNV